MHKKYNTWNNWIAKFIFRAVVSNKPRFVFYLIYNCHDLVTDDLLSRFFDFIIRFYCPVYDNYDSIAVLQAVMETSQVDHCVESFIISTYNRLNERRCFYARQEKQNH